MGSSRQDLVGDSLMHFLTSSSVTGLKVLKAGGTESGVSLNEPEAENVSLILVILCLVSTKHANYIFLARCHREACFGLLYKGPAETNYLVPDTGFS